MAEGTTPSGSPAAGGVAGQEQPLRSVLRPALAVVANITVLTALLVYFGWRRSETQTRRLGFDESVFGSGTRDYLLRSVGSVLVLLIGVAVAALGWVAIDRRLAPYVRAHPPGSPGHSALLLRLLGSAWLVLPAGVWILRSIWPTTTFVLFPASIGAGVLLLQYAGDLHPTSGENDPAARRRTVVARAATAVVVGVCLFWTTSNYAEVEGVRLARSFVADKSRLPGVTVSSRSRLHLEGPGVVEEELGQNEDALRYRYRGLRLLEYAGGRFFLISEGWTPEYGVVFLVRDADDSVRVDFVRDLNPERSYFLIRPVKGRSDPPCGANGAGGALARVALERSDGQEVGCYHVGPPRVGKEGVAAATARLDPAGGGWMVTVTLTSDAVANLEALLRDVGGAGQVAVVIDGEVVAAPRLAELSAAAELVVTALDEPTARRIAARLQE